MVPDRINIKLKLNSLGLSGELSFLSGTSFPLVWGYWGKERSEMSTRCQIGFYDKGQKDLNEFECLIYRHSDGYPGTVDGKEAGVLPDIIPFLKKFDRIRGLEGDCEYPAARLLQHLTDEHTAWFKDWVKREKANKNPKTRCLVDENDVSQFLCYGISKDFHGDIEYFYAVYPSLKQVKVFKVIYNDAQSPKGFEPKDANEWKLLQTVKLA